MIEPYIIFARTLIDETGLIFIQSFLASAEMKSTTLA